MEYAAEIDFEMKDILPVSSPLASATAKHKVGHVCVLCQWTYFLCIPCELTSLIKYDTVSNLHVNEI